MQTSHYIAQWQYTVKNLRYALSVEPENQAVVEKLAWAQASVAAGQHTVPSTIASEWATNPFMRLTEASVKEYTGKDAPVDVLAEVRRRKTEWGRTH